MVSLSNRLERKVEESRGNVQSSAREDIDKAIELTVERTAHDEREADILKSIINFSNVTVKQIMKSRVDVITLPFNSNYKEVLKVIKDCGYSRIPVHREDFDDIAGILYVKDLLNHLEEDDDFEWQTLIRSEVLYVPESKKINELLKEFQQKHLHMGIVVDEYGGSSGIVTLEDVMEEVVGEIKDEFDVEEEFEYVQLDEYNYIFDGKTMLNDVSRIINEDPTIFEDYRGEADSLAGLILEHLGRIPPVNKEISVGPFKLKVLSVSRRRIEKIQLIKTP